MNRDETVELFLKGREAWNTWANALLAERKAMEDAGTWKLRWRLPREAEVGATPETQAWLDKAFADFSHCRLLVRRGEEAFKTAGENSQEGLDNGLFVKSTQHEVDLIHFGGFIFPSGASFARATFSGGTTFVRATFGGGARFDKATFNADTAFDKAVFTGEALFDRAVFNGDAQFGGATLSGDASFDSAIFKGKASFDSATFIGDAWFADTTFTGDAICDSTTFCGNTSFGGTTFSGSASFDGATLARTARFSRATFFNDAFFRGTQFKGETGFELASFKRYASFGASRFEATANFYAIHGERGFNIADSIFEGVPDFIQAHFKEAPRLDDAKVYGRRIKRHPRPERMPETRWQRGWHAILYAGGAARTWPVRAGKGAWRRVRREASSSIPARWRALKRLAIQGHDTERELEYHARELQSQRFETDWPHPPLLFWRLAAWVGFLRFWFGLLYELFSDFGRSIFRPFLLWWATIAVFALYFLAGLPEVGARWHDAGSQGGAASVAAYVKVVHSLLRDVPPCHASAAGEDGKPDPQKLTGLAKPVADSTNALAEAFRLAIRNGSIFLDGGDDSARRSYGCLYGIQSYGGSPAPFVPGFVTDASGLQKLLSALYIFLFGLALRNMLKMK